MVVRGQAARCGVRRGGESPDSGEAAPLRGAAKARVPEKCLHKWLKTLRFHKKYEKRGFPQKNPLRTPAAIRKYPLTGGAEALTGRQTGRRATRRKQTSEADMARRAKKTGRISVNFVSTLFDN